MSVVEALSDIEEANLRIVAQLDALDYGMLYIRDDLTDTYDTHDLDQAYRAMMANQVSVDDFAGVGTFGELDCQVLLFDTVIVFLFPSSRYEGVFVSFDRTQPFPFLDVVDCFNNHAPLDTPEDAA